MDSQQVKLLNLLNIPADFARYEQIADVEVIAQLEIWKIDAQDTLSSLLDLIKQLRVSQAEPEFSLEAKTLVIFTVTAFEGLGTWVTDAARQFAKDILTVLCGENSHHVGAILETHVKPLFRGNPHPSLNLSTGRKLPRLAGGPVGSSDYYESQTWKKFPGVANTVSWCVRHTSSADYEKWWHLIIPPVMTFLDDYEAANKLAGVKMVSELLKQVPLDLLRRTGVDGLLFSSLRTCLNHLRSGETPDLLRAAITTLLTLINLTTPLGSSQRFDQQCTVLGEGVIGTIWFYAYDDSETVLATVDVLPDILRAMGLGCARYLKALISQLTHPLFPKPPNSPPVKLQLSSARALGALIDVCAVRMYRWKGAIIEAVGKCWVTLLDSERVDEQLKGTLQEVCARLARACPSVVQEEYKQLLTANSLLFEELVQCHAFPADDT